VRCCAEALIRCMDSAQRNVGVFFKSYEPTRTHSQRSCVAGDMTKMRGNLYSARCCKRAELSSAAFVQREARACLTASLHSLYVLDWFQDYLKRVRVLYMHRGTHNLLVHCFGSWILAGTTEESLTAFTGTLNRHGRRQAYCQDGAFSS
jgi:hypothetical protein